MITILDFLKGSLQGNNDKNNYDNKKQKTPPIEKSLIDNLIYFRKEFDSSADLTIREIDINGTKAAIVTMESMVSGESFGISVLNPIFESNLPFDMPVEKKFNLISNSITSASEQVVLYDFEEAFHRAMSGFALFLIDGYDRILAIGVQGFKYRSVSEPSTEVMQHGSQEGFVEAIKPNMSLIRRRIKNPKLKFEKMELGSVSKTDVFICYIRDIASDEILNKLRMKLHNVNLETLLAPGYLTSYLDDSKGFSFFNGVASSERPDTVCAKISEGRIAILVDGMPNVIIVPYLFVEYFQTMDDYSSRPYYATFIRWLKYFAAIFATLLPGFYVAVGSFNPEIFPNELLNKIAKSVNDTPFPLMLEALLIFFIYEIMREAGLRLPKSMGHAVSIVGVLVIGETAISSGLIGATTLMILAITAISSYVIPNLYEPIAVLRLIFILIGGTLGVWGIMLFLSIILVNICGKSNYGVPFTSPIAPFSWFGMRDVLIRANWKILSKNRNPVQDMPGTNLNVKEK